MILGEISQISETEIFTSYNWANPRNGERSTDNARPILSGISCDSRRGVLTVSVT